MRRQQTSCKDKKSWSASEDKLLLALVDKYGTSKWTAVSTGLGAFDRSGKQCRERYHNHLSPGVQKGNWSSEEDALIHTLQKKFGNAWARITEHLPGRTDNAVKNRFWSSERSRIRRKGVALRRNPAPKMNKNQNNSSSSSSSASSITNDSMEQLAPTITYVQGNSSHVHEEDEDMLFKDLDETQEDKTQEAEGKVVTPVLAAQTATAPIQIKVEQLPALNDNTYPMHSYVSSPSSYSSSRSSSCSSDDEDEIQILNDCDFWEGMDDSAITAGPTLQLQASTSITYSDELFFGLPSDSLPV